MSNTHRPRIAITPCSKLPDYVESVRQAGGDPWVLDIAHDRVEDVLAGAEGVLLTGGGDVDPTRYATTPHPAFSAAESGRDEFELQLARRASEADMPLLAVCRGVQVLNVARGGTLYQHLPDEVPSDTHHEIRDTPDTLAHRISIVPGTLLSRVLPASAVRVNSRHHQAVRAVGTGLTVSATAEDGVVEALEDPSRTFMLGVQWHPENFWRTRAFGALFDALIGARRTRH